MVVDPHGTVSRLAGRSAFSGSEALRRRLEALEHRWAPGREQCGGELRRVEPALLRRWGEPTRRSPGCVRRGQRDSRGRTFSGHDCRPNREPGAPVGRVQRGLKEEAEDRVVFGREVALKGGDLQTPARGSGEECAEARGVLAARAREAAVRQLLRALAIAPRERRLQDRLDRGHKGLPWVIEQQICDFSTLFLDHLLWVMRAHVVLRHAAVMPGRRSKYKTEMRVS